MKHSQINNKNVLVTGGTRGIGHAIVKEFISKGYNVYYTGTHQPTPDISTASFMPVDFLNDSAFTEFKKNVSNLNIDILVNNAGINIIGEFENYSTDNFKKLLKVNIETPFELCQSVLANMKKKNWGRIVNISSIFGKISKEYRAPYSSTKFALDGMTIGLAAEVAPYGILANCVAPGFIDTELTHKILGAKGIAELTERIPIKRLGKSEEIAKLVVWLSSDENSYLTGQNIAIDGGFTRV